MKRSNRTALSKTFFVFVKERSQLENKIKAIALLKSKLLVILEEQKAAEIKEIRGDVVKAEWGQEIRNYVFHPYRLVHDLRTNVETSDISGIMDGNVEPLLTAYLISSLAWRGNEDCELQCAWTESAIVSSEIAARLLGLDRRRQELTADIATVQGYESKRSSAKYRNQDNAILEIGKPARRVVWSTILKFGPMKSQTGQRVISKSAWSVSEKTPQIYLLLV
ncbi:hypothetical protein SELMODRAFT_431302 [Selaginella moellendorffii]|uniref:Prokaryotic-type class I peptide chain release factors domain-containing protein n=1 Tax=Selaginella moellendorffii TaxID=88036 RepID=D8TC61_SELML|nr:hypothetical protein SELMODRAFT_431302 [Selaginella moellendorffii]